MPGLPRRAVAETVGRWVRREGRALFVGNGYILRDVANVADAPSNFYLFGGMGIASAVAAGYVASNRSGRAAVLEGDGGFFMGLAGTAFCASNGLDIVHVVYANGIYESSGGQPLQCPLSLSRVDALARGLGYSSGLTDEERASGRWRMVSGVGSAVFPAGRGHRVMRAEGARTASTTPSGPPSAGAGSGLPPPL